MERERIVTFKMSTEEYARLKDAAMRDDRTVSAFIRVALDVALKGRVPA